MASFVKCPEPTCGKRVEYQVRIQDGRHREAACDCGADLQWDDPGPQVPMRSGPPQPCQHQEKQRKGTLVPLPWHEDAK